MVSSTTLETGGHPKVALSSTDRLVGILKNCPAARVLGNLPNAGKRAMLRAPALPTDETVYKGNMNARPRIRKEADDRRQQIIDAALILIGEQGYRGFTIQSLAKRCELSNAGLLHYFGSKDALLLGVLEEIVHREAVTVSSMVTEALRHPSQENLAKALRAMARSIADKPEVSRFMVRIMAETIAVDHPAHRWFRQQQSRTLDLLAAMAEGWSPEPARLAIQIAVLLSGFPLQWLHSSGEFDLIQEWDIAVETLLYGHIRLAREPS